jgi:hypothetical protein
MNCNIGNCNRIFSNNTSITTLKNHYSKHVNISKKNIAKDNIMDSSQLKTELSLHTEVYTVQRKSKLSKEEK